jgi:hypothetical protein
VIVNRRAIAGVAAAAVGVVVPVAAVLIATPTATAADHPYCPLGFVPASPVINNQQLCVDVNTTQGVHAGAKVTDLVCVRVDAVEPHPGPVAKAKVRVPCPPTVVVPTEPGTEPVVPVIPVVPVVPPTTGDDGSDDSSVPQAPPATVVPAHLPVTG